MIGDNDQQSIVSAYKKYNDYLLSLKELISQSKWSELALGSIRVFYDKNSGSSCSITAEFKIGESSMLCHLITCWQSLDDARDPINVDYHKELSVNLLICFEGENGYELSEFIISRLEASLGKYFNLKPVKLFMGIYYTREHQISLDEFVEILDLLNAETSIITRWIMLDFKS